MREASGGKRSDITNIFTGRGFDCSRFRAVRSTSQHQSDSSPASDRKNGDLYEFPKSRRRGNEAENTGPVG